MRWDVAYGSSGTIGAVGDVLGAAGWPAGTITREGLDWLREQLVAAAQRRQVRMDGLKEDRRPVIGGGISVLRAVFDLLEIDQMQVAQGALRHGALYDMLDREHSETDIRSTTVQRLAAKFEADAVQAQRVGRVACAAAAPVAPGRHADELARHERKLGWAAQLHEIGSLISHSDYHKHGAYILDNTDALGFALPELHRLSLLVLGHRGKLRKLEARPGRRVASSTNCCACGWRSILCHARRDPDLKGLQLRAAGRAGHAGGAARLGQGLSAIGPPAARGSAWPGRKQPGP